jgi:transcriptional regulator with XRE-family HTH domain
MGYGWNQSETIGVLLARVRQEQGVTQLRLAERLCASSGQATVTRHEVSRWEREERVPSGYWLAWLAVALDVPLAELERAAGVARRRRRPGPQPLARPGWVVEAAGVYRRAS